MNNGKPRNRQQGGGSGGQRRRRGRSNNSSNNNRGDHGAPRGPVMTSLGESTYEAVLDHGTTGYGVWFDGCVRDDPMYRQHWRGGRSIYVKIDSDQIVITRELPGKDTGDDHDSDDSANSNGNDAGNSNVDVDDTSDNGSEAKTKPAPRRGSGRTRRKTTPEDDGVRDADAPEASANDAASAPTSDAKTAASERPSTNGATGDNGDRVYTADEAAKLFATTLGGEGAADE